MSDRVRAEIVETGPKSRSVRVWVDGVEIEQTLILGGYPPALLAAFDARDLRFGDFLTEEGRVVPESELFALASERRAAERERGPIPAGGAA